MDFIIRPLTPADADEMCIRDRMYSPRRRFFHRYMGTGTITSI